MSDKGSIEVVFVSVVGDSMPPSRRELVSQSWDEWGRNLKPAGSVV